MRSSLTFEKKRPDETVGQVKYCKPQVVLMVLVCHRESSLEREKRLFANCRNLPNGEQLITYIQQG